MEEAIRLFEFLSFPLPGLGDAVGNPARFGT